MRKLSIRETNRNEVRGANLILEARTRKSVHEGEGERGVRRGQVEKTWNGEACGV